MAPFFIKRKGLLATSMKMMMDKACKTRSRVLSNKYRHTFEKKPKELWL
jgi:hypothetical protein